MGADAKQKSMIDFLWPTWNGTFDDEIMELVVQEVNNSTQFFWHTYLNESNNQVGAKYRAWSAVCTGGPIPTGPAAHDQNLGLLGVTELGDEQKEELNKLQEHLKHLRRKTVKFVSLPAVGAASGAEFTMGQMQSVWDTLSLGHRFTRKKGDVRAFIASAELFPPNIVKQGAKTMLRDPMLSDATKYKRVIEFFISKRGKDDILIFFDGRGRDNRRVIESFETQLATANHTLIDYWCVYVDLRKKDDPRAAARETSFSSNNREMVYFSMPTTMPRKVMHRSEFNHCGEKTSAATTYTGIGMRSFSELPRMDHDTKAGILGAASCASFDCRQRRLQADVDENSKYFSGAMLEARRLLGLSDEDGDNKEEEDDDSESADDEI